MSGSIRLSEKHGVNPSLGICIFCGEAKDVLLFGRLPDDKEAPRECIHDWEPCAKCSEHMKEGCFFVEARPNMSDKRKSTPTGRVVCIRDAGVNRMLKHESKLREDILTRRFCLVSPEDFEAVFGEHIRKEQERVASGKKTQASGHQGPAQSVSG